jgi:hypothetical protein
VSHDGLTRLLQADWSGQTFLKLAWRTLFACERDYLILDDTVIPEQRYDHRARADADMERYTGTEPLTVTRCINRRCGNS